MNPATGTGKRREAAPAALDCYEVEEVQVLARACRAGQQRATTTIYDANELTARAREDQQDAEALRLLFSTGLRLGEVRTLRWETSTR